MGHKNSKVTTTTYTNPTMRYLSDAFKNNNSTDALKVIEAVKENIGWFAPDSTFIGSLKVINPNIKYIAGIYNAVTKQNHNKYIKNSHNGDTFNSNPTKYKLKIDNIKPVWLAYLFTISDIITKDFIVRYKDFNVEQSNWTQVFEELFKLSHCSLDDELFGVPVHRFIINDNHSYGFKIPQWFNCYTDLIKNSNIMFENYTQTDNNTTYDIIEWCIYKDLYKILEALLTHKKALATLINKKPYLHIIEDMCYSLNNKQHFIKLLIAHGQEVYTYHNNMSVFQHALNKGSYISLMYYLANYKVLAHLDQEENIIFRIVQETDNYTDLLSLILTQVVDDNATQLLLTKDTTTPFHIACRSHKCVYAKLILNAAIKLNITKTLLRLTDQNVRTPLHVACREGREETIIMLLKTDLDNTYMDDTRDTILHSLLHNKKIMRQVPNVLKLINLIPKETLTKIINNKNKDDNTALHMVYNNLEISKLLVTLGADITIKNSKGLTPLQLAYNNNYIDIATELHKFARR
jgi:hypothetical protein